MLNRRKAFRFTAGLVTLLVALSPLAASASSVRPVALDEIIDTAAVAFQGRCIETHSERDASTGRVVTFTTFQVDETLKGRPASTHTIKQIGGRVGNFVEHIDGIPSFTPGEDYVVFLYGVSPLGFSSPVALSQGRFSVTTGPRGRGVTNGRDFRELLPEAAGGPMPPSVRAQAHAAAGEAREMDLAEFKQLVHGRTGQ